MFWQQQSTCHILNIEPYIYDGSNLSVLDWLAHFWWKRDSKALHIDQTRHHMKPLNVGASC